MADPSQDPEVIKFRAERTAALRQKFLKEIHNPYRHASGEGGYLFDPAIQRYMAMKATYWDNFKVTPKSSKVFLFMTLFPIMGFAYLLNKEKSYKENLYRTGQVAYADRRFKFL